nr:NUDIX domain-containing protein [Bacillus sp. ISL-41]
MAICLFKKGESILAAEGYDSVNKDYYYRPIGGGIEYGEKSVDALEREVQEEISAEIKNINYLGTIENIFTFNGELGHEVVIVYEAEFKDEAFYNLDTFTGKEDDGTIFSLKWIPISEFGTGKLRLVPDGLLGLIL